jgi:hypothetical protein
MQLRKTEEGTKIVGKVSEVSEEQSFTPRFLEREIASGFVEVEIKLKPSKGKAIVYRVTGFGPLDKDNPDDDRVNYTDIRAERVK